MEIFRSGAEVKAWREGLRARGASLAFVPTMGALHPGHFSLIKQAQALADCVLVSIFVNPLQFASETEYRNYPRAFEDDLAALSDCGSVQALFLPEAKEIFPETLLSEVVYLSDPEDLPLHYKEVLCFPYRPGHFAGVARVVERFFFLLEPEYAFFGLKDYQQAKIIEDLNRRRGWGVDLHFCPTVRDEDRLVVSSRNRFLSPFERRRAAMFPRILFAAAERIISGHAPQSVLSMVQNELKAHFKLEYLNFLTAKDLKPWQEATYGDSFVLAAAVYCGKVRLIDAILIPTAK